MKFPGAWQSSFPSLGARLHVVGTVGHGVSVGDGHAFQGVLGTPLKKALAELARSLLAFPQRR